MKFKLIHNHITDEQLKTLADQLSADDKREVRAVGFINILSGLRLSIKSSKDFTYITTHDDQPAAVAGVVPDGDRSGLVWLLTTDAVRTSPLSFVKQAKYWVDSKKSQYYLLHNIADARNINHLKLLKLLGFKRLGYQAVGPEKRTFVEFAKLL